MAIIIPGIRNEYGATTADVIAEQIALCKANILTIEKIAFYRKPREKRDEINRRLRACHDFMGMAGSRKFGCLYREVGLKSETPVVCEHAIPVTVMVTLYEKGTPFEDLAFFPVARIAKASDQKFGSLGLTVSGHALESPFLRYYTAGIEIETHHGRTISCKDWSMQDHWKLIDETPELAAIRRDVLIKLTAEGLYHRAAQNRVSR